ncbi:hypothetical protein [Streptomyces scabiei]|uniref:hypothetical protein n=1 Tax=Streptomyces scabiei TaxID=1930 RepID=UPI003A94607D
MTEPEGVPAADEVRPSSAATSEAASAVARTGRRRSRPPGTRGRGGALGSGLRPVGGITPGASTADLPLFAGAAPAGPRDAAGSVVTWGARACRVPDGRDRCRAA